MTSIFPRKGRRGVTLKYKDASGRWRMRHFATRTAAEAVAKRIRAGGHVEGPLFRDFAARWLERTALGVRESTAEDYRTSLRAHIIPAFGHLGIEKITRAGVRDFLTAKRASGLAIGTVRNLRGTLRACLAEAVEDGLLAANPAAGQRFRMLEKAPAEEDEPEEIRALDAEQLGRFLETARAVLTPQRALILRTMALTGMRIGEASALQWDDIDLKAGTALVRRSVSRNRIGSPKTGRRRTVDLAGGLVEELKAHDARTKAIALQRGAERLAWVFPSRAGRPDVPRMIRLDFRRVLAKAELPPHFTPHCLRHSYASLMLSGGRSVYYVQRQLGHARITMTADLYGRWLPAGDRASADWLEGLVSPSPVTTAREKGPSSHSSR